MNGLRTSRVLVVDDDVLNNDEHRSEAFGIIQAFSSAGIGTIFSDGNVQHLPEKPYLNGIRLVAADMALGPSDGDPAHVIGQTLSVMRALLRADNGPYLAIAWTKHPELVDAFTDGAKSLPCPPVGVVTLAKGDVTQGDGSYNFEAIKEALIDALVDAYPLEIYNLWEQVVHDAASDVSRAFAGSGDTWSNAAAKSLAALLRAKLKDRSDERLCLQAIFEALNPLHSDYLESRTLGMDILTGQLNQIRTTANAATDGSLSGALNRQLLVGLCAQSPAPGDVYSLDSIRRALPTGAIFPRLADLRDDLIHTQHRSSEGAKRTLGVAIELTPMCDHHNGDMLVPRFLLGLAVPAGHENVLKSPHSLFKRRVGPITFDGLWPEGQYLLVWDAHYLVTIPLTVVSTIAAKWRLRHEVLVDLQAWASAQAARPGYLDVQAR